ncbi:TetR/AcrR family transcriptional regulator [Rahnella sp. BCC 1045]|uniref:TetR/AcrR family transcriptional regulator n=1 Tax=Rahnella sp. BCC 1045 TaxID=2816251 RepID=UPI001C278ACB|nr:TetR/AcrR family transcriptional regulator [Rahnella sp. BCC 1045]MBU9818359.1 TetR/AcrR family transcriptional regulator [Rahnella sp. BCC 1045]
MSGLSQIENHPYHRGNVPELVLDAAERILKRSGIAGLGLRSIAREAGVSHAAPKHHFHNLPNLLSELASMGYLELQVCLKKALHDEPNPILRRKKLASAYIGFAHENPSMFGLMFRNELIQTDNDKLRQVIFETMTLMIGTLQKNESPFILQEDRIEKVDAMRMTVSWALIHGMATLLIDNRLMNLAELSNFESAHAMICKTLELMRFQVDFYPEK